jgi:stringent starvation protein B
MGKLDSVKPNEVKVLLESYFHVWIGTRKTGKTTLFRDLVYEKYNGDMSKGLLLGFEKGYQALDGIHALDINEWTDYNEIIEELIDKRDTVSYKLICIDTIDDMVTMAEQESIRYWNRKTNTKSVSINEAGGGYGRGKDYTKTLLRNNLQKLLKAGFGVIVIGHSKLKTVKEKEGVEYNQLSCSLTNDYGDIFMDMADLIAFFTIEKEIVNNIAKKTTAMQFRSDGFVDCGGRFKGLPDKVPYGAKSYLKVFEEAIKSSMLSNKDVDFDKLKEKQEEERKQHAQEYVAKVKDPSNEEIVGIIQSKVPTLPDEEKNKIFALLENSKITSFDEPDKLNHENLMQIYALLK